MMMYSSPASVNITVIWLGWVEVGASQNFYFHIIARLYSLLFPSAIVCRDVRVTVGVVHSEHDAVDEPFTF